MSSKGQHSLVDGFETARPSFPLFCHQEFLEKIVSHHGDGIGRRAAFLMQRLAIDPRRLHYKATSGLNRGWRRSRLGGSQGSHYYAWWAPRNAVPLQDSPDFPTPSTGAVVLRDIRHHDDHSPLTPQAFENYLEVTVPDLRKDEYAPAPWTPPQARFATARQAVRLLKGHPGSGKTTALWHAADSTGAPRVLYVTYSRDLVALARDYFDRYCSAHKHFGVVTFPDLVSRISGAPVAPAAVAEARSRFGRDLSPFSRYLGPWTGNPAALYDEFHAHLVGDALPLELGRFAACNSPRVPEKTYRERRVRFLGLPATSAALDAASRLERSASGSLAERYFPELHSAWHALKRLGSRDPKQLDPDLLSYECIAVDECQDLTPMEACLLVQLAALINSKRRTPIPLLMAGDEAQTVRPTDFEWGWLSDLLHFQIGSPAEHKLSSNLRSPRRLAELVNSVWDLYHLVQKQDRPSGAGYAQIDDDASDQLLYCAAASGPELDALFTTLASREGLALITLEDTVPAFVPEAVKGSVLTVREAKGLDFHSVCVIDPGRHIARVVRDDDRVRVTSEVDELRKRLAIDQLRVALSRPTERLFWLDVNPSDLIVRFSMKFLSTDITHPSVAPCVPAALLKTLEEEELDQEERIQRCQSDARQYLDVKPEMALSRAQHAVTLLGRAGTPSAVTDAAVRTSAYMTLAEVCFVLAMRATRLPNELGRMDLFNEAAEAAILAPRRQVAYVILAIGQLQRVASPDRLEKLSALAHCITNAYGEMEPWLLVELQSRSKAWVEELEAALTTGNNAQKLLVILPAFYAALDMADREARTQRLRQRAVQLLLKEKRYSLALSTLEQLPDRQPKLEAACYEGLLQFDKAAESHRAAGNPKDALRCYRLVPDLAAALTLARELNDTATADSLEWIGRLQELVSQRPDKFTKVVTAAEKKLLEEALERALGVTRKAAVKKAPAGRKAAAKKAAPAKKAASPRTRKKVEENPFF